MTQDEAHLAVERARDALRENRRSDARQWAEHAARLAPQMEDPWLILAAIASPKASLEYIQKALKINPNSQRARRGMEWAMQRLGEPEPPLAETRQSLVSKLPAGGAQAAPVPAAHAAPAPHRKPRSPLALILLGIGLLVCMAAGVSAAMSPALASFVQQVQPARPPSWAVAQVAKPTYAPNSPLALDTQPAEATQATQATEAVEPSPTLALETPTFSLDSPLVDPSTPTLVGQQPPTEELPTAEPTWSGSLAMDYVDTPGAPTPNASYNAGGGEHWIDVNLTQQTLYAYEGNTVVNSFLISSGTWLHPTVTGRYHVYVKLRYTDMTGADYYLPNVPYTMYFYQSYGLHGTYWHHNFGTPMSHGCVNLSIPDAEWLYNFSSVGTLVNIHY